MNKTIANLILLILDIISIYASYYSIKTWIHILNNIDSQVEKITFQWPVGAYFISLIIPIIHILSFFSGKKIFYGYLGYIIGGCFILIIFIIYSFNIKITNKLNSSHYVYHPEMSNKMTFSIFKTYLKKDESESN